MYVCKIMTKQACSKYPNLITVLGHTAAGKTKLAVYLVREINSEIISADSRQVYKNMDIGTGKDLDDYYIDGQKINYHLIDILPAGEKYNVFEFQKDFFKIFEKLRQKEKIPIVCGGSGMYIESVLNAYKLIHVPVNEQLRAELEQYDLNELEKILKSYKSLHNKSDTDTKKRALRAIEIEHYYKENSRIQLNYPEVRSFNIGVKYDREIRRKRITERLKQRLKNGMIEEAEMLIRDKGLSYSDLEYYGLEYKFLALYLSGKINYSEMFEKLNTAIHQFAKRQMTWFRKMEKEGHKIHWINVDKTIEDNVNEILIMLEAQK